MYTAAIPDPAPESEMSLAAAEATLDRVAAAIDQRFVGAGQALAQAYSIVENLVTALEGVTNALGRDAADAAVENLRGTADRLERLPTVQSSRQEALARIQQMAKPLRDHIAQVNRTLDFLRICGLNIKVAAAGAEGFSAFADTMFARLDVGEVEMAGIADEIDRLMAGIPAVIEVDRQLAGECARVIPHVPRKLAADAAALRAHQAADSARAAHIAEVARDLRGKVGLAIGAMQIGDITRQRLEHVAQGLRLLAAFRDGGDGADPAVADAVAAHVLALLAAQAADTIAAFQAEARVLAANVRGIGPGATALLQIREQGEGEQGEEGAFLIELEQSVAEIATVTARLHDADQRALVLGTTVSDTAERLARRLGTVHRVNQDVHQMAWNTDLRCNRMGTEGRGLAMVAAEIRSFANTLSDISATISASVDALAGAVLAVRGPDADAERDVGQALGESLDLIREGAQRMRDGMAGLDHDAAAIAQILHETTANIDCEAAFGGDLEAVAATLQALAAAATDPDEAVSERLAPLLDDLAARYTMAREREIHRQFALGGPAEIAAEAGPAADDDDDFDDGLF